MEQLLGSCGFCMVVFIYTQWMMSGLMEVHYKVSKKS